MFEQPKPSYNLSDEAVQVLTDELIIERGSEFPKGTDRVVIRLDGTDKYANIARHVEAEVFYEKFGNTHKIMHKEYDRYEEASKFLLSIDPIKGVVTGVLRIISDSPAGLKTLNDVQKKPFNVDIDHAFRTHGIQDVTQVWDIGTVAVLKEFRYDREPISITLDRALLVDAREQGIPHFVSMIDLPALAGMIKTGLPFVKFDDASSGTYIDSAETQPVYLALDNLEDRMIQYHAESSRPGSFIARVALETIVDGKHDDSILLGN